MEQSKFKLILLVVCGTATSLNAMAQNTSSGSNTECESDRSQFKFVDMGLSVKWATCNVGADHPNESGDYYAWGETETKDYYSWDNYKWSNGEYGWKDSRNPILTKYCTDSDCGKDGFTDNKITLEPNDDVAHVKWGGSWRMPTNDEMAELYNNCTWSLITMGDVQGYLVRSKMPGYTDRTIFLPAAGCYTDMVNWRNEPYGYYWTSTLCKDSPFRSYQLYYHQNVVESETFLNRSVGRSVRPVCP